MFTLYEKVVAGKLKVLLANISLQQCLQKQDLRGQIRTKQVNKMETSGIVYEVDCKFVFKKVYW